MSPDPRFDYSPLQPREAASPELTELHSKEESHVTEPQRAVSFHNPLFPTKLHLVLLSQISVLIFGTSHSLQILEQNMTLRKCPALPVALCMVTHTRARNTASPGLPGCLHAAGGRHTPTARPSLHSPPIPQRMDFINNHNPGLFTANLKISSPS